MGEIMSLIIVLLTISYVICMILVPVAICRIWHWSYKCFQELHDLNDVLIDKDNFKQTEPDLQTIEEFAAQVNSRPIPQGPEEFAMRCRQMLQICKYERKKGEGVV